MSCPLAATVVARSSSSAQEEKREMELGMETTDMCYRLDRRLKPIVIRDYKLLLQTAKNVYFQINYMSFLIATAQTFGENLSSAGVFNRSVQWWSILFMYTKSSGRIFKTIPVSSSS